SRFPALTKGGLGQVSAGLAGDTPTQADHRKCGEQCDAEEGRTPSEMGPHDGSERHAQGNGDRQPPADDRQSPSPKRWSNESGGESGRARGGETRRSRQEDG